MAISCGKTYPAGLADIASKVENGERLTQSDGVRLYESNEIHTLGKLANLVRERLHGRVAYFNINRHINYSNLCVLRCKFCAFYVPYEKGSPDSGAEVRAHDETQGAGNQATDGRRGGGTEGRRDGGAERRASRLAEPTQRGQQPGLPVMAAGGRERAPYVLSVEEIVARAKEAYDRGATEVHIVGGLHPTLPFSYYTDMCRSIREACPRLHIKAFTAIEIIHFTRISRPRRTIADVLTALREAGLGSLPGGGAEIFDDRVHDEAFAAKVGEAEWFDVHRTAHELGIFTNATMLYGHVETRAERVQHLIKLRAHQDRSLSARRAYFNCVIPLSFVPRGSALAHLPGPTGLEDLKTLAISRLMLDNVPHVKAFWVMQTPKLAQVSLNWGVDDVDGTVVYYDITQRENGGGTTHQELTADELKRLIREAGCQPVERDTLYRRVARQGGDWQVM